MVNGIIDGMDSISAVDGYCRGAVFLYVVELVKIKRNEDVYKRQVYMGRRQRC